MQSLLKQLHKIFPRLDFKSQAATCKGFKNKKEEANLQL